MTIRRTLTIEITAADELDADQAIAEIDEFVCNLAGTYACQIVYYEVPQAAPVLVTEG